MRDRFLIMAGSFHIYIGDEEVTHTKSISLDHAEGSDASGVSVFDRATDYTVTFTVDGRNPVFGWYIAMMRRARRERKALLRALERGYVIHILCRYNDGSEGYFELTSPGQLRRVMRLTAFLPAYRIYDRYWARYIVRKGRVVPMRIWPVTKGIIDEYERKLKRDDI